MDFLFDPAVVTIVSKSNDSTHSILTAGPNSSVQDFSVTPTQANQGGPNNNAGDYRLDLLDLDSTGFESGAGPLVHINLLASNSPGTSSLTLDDLVTGDGTPDVYDSTGTAAYPVSNIGNAQVVVGGSCPASLDAPAPVVAGARQEPSTAQQELVPVVAPKSGNLQANGGPQALPNAGGQPSSGSLSDSTMVFLIAALGSLVLLLGLTGAVVTKRRLF
jgi:hypothetical protein